ncbi:ADP-ribosylation factor-like protein 15 isoform X1 [Panthera onca]
MVRMRILPQPLVAGQGHMTCFGQRDASRHDPSPPVSCTEELAWASLRSLLSWPGDCGHLCWYGGALRLKLPEMLSQHLEGAQLSYMRGFSIKAVPFQNAILNVKELGGADNIRKYWSRYYQGSQGVIFVLDSASSEDDLETARNELHSALQHPQLCTLPFLILANHQDKPAARSVQEVKKYFELEPLARGKRWILQPCSLDDMDALKDSFSQLINLLEEKDHEAVRM